MCSENTLKTILDCISMNAKRIFGKSLHSVILYGSYARGDFDEESDIDIMIIADIAADELSFYKNEIDKLCGFLLYEFGMVVSITEKDSDTFFRFADILPFYKNIKKEGIKIA